MKATCTHKDGPDYMCNKKYCSSCYFSKSKDTQAEDYIKDREDERRAEEIKDKVDIVMNKFHAIIDSLRPIPVKDYAQLETHCFDLWRLLTATHEVQIDDLRYTIDSLVGEITYHGDGKKYAIIIRPIK